MNPHHIKFLSRISLPIVAIVVTGTLIGSAFAQNQTSASSSPSIIQGAPTNNMTLESAREQFLTAWNQTAFNATFSTFVDPLSAAGYGVYHEHGNVFRPGESIVLYVEPVGFHHRQVIDNRGNTLYLINMTADYAIADPSGRVLQTIKDVPVGNIVSHRANTELFLMLTLTQDQAFPTGNYTIRYTVNDQVSGQSFQLEKQITVAENTSSLA